jgi:hypothetical protein
LVADDVASVRLRVELTSDGHSTLWIGLPEGTSRREFRETVCADAVLSIAVMASMVLEMDAAQRFAATASFMDSSEPAAPKLKSAPAAADAPLSVPIAPPLPAVVSLRSNASAPSPRESFSLVWRLAGGALLESAVASSAPLGATLGVDASLERTARSVWAPSARLELLGTLNATEHAAAGDASLRLLAARAHVCPVALVPARVFRLLPCLSFDAGSLRARGTGATPNPITRHMPWLTAGVMLRAELSLGLGVSLEAEAGLRRLSRHDRFFFRTDSTAYQVPAWSTGLGLGLAVRMP